MRTAGPRTSDRSPRRAFRPALGKLEKRELLATTVSVLMATPATLNPPNNRFVAVRVFGNVIDSSPKATPHAVYQVTDQYRRIEPGGRVTLTKVTPTVYAFSFTVTLEARRGQADVGGRHYYIEVGSEDTQNAGGQTIAVYVPHDKLKPGHFPITSGFQLPTHTPKHLPPANPPSMKRGLGIL